MCVCVSASGGGGGGGGRGRGDNGGGTESSMCAFCPAEKASEMPIKRSLFVGNMQIGL